MSDDMPDHRVTMADVLALPDRQRRLVIWLMREGERALGVIAAYLKADEATAREIVADLVGRGFVTRIATPGGDAVVASLGTSRAQRVPHDLWRALD